jgi:hypothetical protein
MRYRNAAMAEFMRALKTLKALQAEPADRCEQPAAGAGLARELPVTPLVAPVRARRSRPAARRAPAEPRANAEPRGPNEPEPLMAYLLPEPAMTGPALHEPAASPIPNEPERASPLPPAPAVPVAQRAAGGTIAGALIPSATDGGARRTAPGR